MPEARRNHRKLAQAGKEIRGQQMRLSLQLPGWTPSKSHTGLSAAAITAYLGRARLKKRVRRGTGIDGSLAKLIFDAQ